MDNLPEVTKNLIIINVLFFLGQGVFGATMNQYMALYPVQSDLFNPYQIATHMFMHGGLSHIFFNMLTLFMFGRDIEYAFGAKRFLLFYLVTGVGAASLHLLASYIEINYLLGSVNEVKQLTGMMMVNKPAVGASGAIYGLLAAFAMLYPNRVIMLLFPPIPLKAKYFVLIFGGLELYMGIMERNSGVAHFAHVGGAAMGALMILYWRRKGMRF